MPFHSFLHQLRFRTCAWKNEPQSRSGLTKNLRNGVKEEAPTPITPSPLTKRCVVKARQAIGKLQILDGHAILNKPMRYFPALPLSRGGPWHHNFAPGPSLVWTCSAPPERYSTHCLLPHRTFNERCSPRGDATSQGLPDRKFKEAPRAMLLILYATHCAPLTRMLSAYKEL